MNSLVRVPINNEILVFTSSIVKGSQNFYSGWIFLSSNIELRIDLLFISMAIKI